MKRWVFSILAISVCALAGQALEPAFQITFQVLDEEGKPLAGATAGVSAENGSAHNPSERIKSSDGVSDQKGQVTLDGRTYISTISYGVEKEGYYQVYGQRYRFKDSRLLRWQPWNPTIEVVLKRIKNPVPMYAKRVDKGLPVLGQKIGYDLEKGDWVVPYGQGEMADFNFVGTLKKLDGRNGDFEILLTFSNPGDGIQRFTCDPYPSVFPSPYEAPADGYQSMWKQFQIRRAGERDVTNYDPKAGYFFRVRTQLDASGKVERALYGKIYGDFFSMVYYLNPDGTRNMEFDNKRNLLRPKVVTNRDRYIYDVGP